MTRTVLAFLLSPLPAPALYYVSAVFLQDSGGDFTLANLGMVYLLGLPLAYLAVLAIGMPLHFLSTRRHWKAIAWYLVGGAIAGFAVWLLVSSLAELGYYVVTLACLAAVGAVCGAIFFAVLKMPAARAA